jgi:hypothetical protein
VWVSYDNLWVFFAGSAGLILVLYAVKALALRYLRWAGAGLAFAAAAALCVPVTWAISPDWENRHVLWVAIYVGNPVATLTVPCVSFLIDWAWASTDQPSAWLWRLPLEWLAVPVWFFFWVYFEFLALGWVWI